MTRTDPDTQHLFVIAGEASGDLHASALVRELSVRDPRLRFSGIGGARLQDAGLELLHHSDQLSFMGFAEVIRHLPYLRRVMRDVRLFLEEYRPALVILVDFPAFNLRVARIARELGLHVLYYIAPQVWAWHEERVATLAEVTDVIACVLPFEKQFFDEKGKTYGVEPAARFVGHPLIDGARPSIGPSAFRDEMLLPGNAEILALLPGSRIQEISRLLPPMAGAARIAGESRPELIPVIAAAPGIPDSVYDQVLARSGERRAPSVPPGGRYRPEDGLHLSRGCTYDLLEAARGALVASGTATLETGLLETPMVIAYRMSRLSWWISRRRVKVEHVGLVNLVAGKRLIPELLQEAVTPQMLADHLAPFLEEGSVRDEIVAGLHLVRERLGGGGATARTADIALELLENRATGSAGEDLP
ncbi:lipid-A-disaccharide synthase [Gemmatimonadota bacterium]